jgi:hypothetical protein
MPLFIPPLVNISAGTTSQNSSAYVFSNSNGISFGLNAGTITASVGAGGAAGSISAGTTSVGLGQVVFSNSNGVSFGLNGSTVTASVAPGAGAPNFSAGTTSNNLGSVVFSNSNGLAFGLNGSTITGSYTVPSTAGLLSAFNVSAGTTSSNLNSVVFSNSNGLAFGLNGSTVTGSYTVPSTAGLISAVNISAGTTSSNVTNFVFSNSNGLAFGLNGSTVTGSYTVPNVPAQTVQTQNVVVPSAGTQTATSGTAIWSNSNGISFGMAGSATITASYTVPSTAGLISAVNFSAGTTSGNVGSIVFSNSNGVTFGLNGSTITASAAGGGGNVNFSAGTTSSGLNSVVFSNLNGVSFGLNGSTITGSVAVAGGNALNWFALGNTTQNSSSVLSTGSISLNGIGALTVGYSNNSIQLSAPQTSSMVGTGQVSIVTNVSTISIGVPAQLTRSMFNPYEEAPMVVTKYANGSLHISPIPEMPNIQFDRMVVGIHGSNTTTGVGSFSFSFAAGLYTRNVSTLSLFASASNSTTFSVSTAVNSASFLGMRNWSIGWTTTVSAGDYWMGFLSSTSSANSAVMSFQNIAVSGFSQGFSGNFNAAVNATNQDILGLGFYSAATAAMPASIAFSQIQGTNQSVANIPFYGFLSQTA